MIMRWMTPPWWKKSYAPGELIYAGTLEPTVVGWIRGTVDRYPFPVEVTRNGDTSMLPQYESEGEDCMGQSYKKMSQAWCTMPVKIGGTSRFYFFPSQADKDRFIQGNQDIVINTEPFKTAI